ncbi:hypothetical protein ACFV6E_13895 [Streptomyces sp. NPDC059785]|uniref:hypothetical protein n=1 Tax=Streptomyces sp. NPDC059785 TaxID=3346945 RepID=UPI00364D6FCE
MSRARKASAPARSYLAAGGQALCALLLALQAFLGHVPAAGVLGLVALQSCFVAGGAPASRTFLPHLLPARQLAAGPALRRIAFQGAMPLGPALGGLIVGGTGVGACYLIDAAVFGAASYGAAGLPQTKSEGEPARPGLRGVLDGLAFLGRTPVIRGALLTDPATTGLALLAVAGAADTVSVVSRSTVVQLHTPPELLGRVSAAEQIVGQAGPDIGNMRGGLVVAASSGAAALVSGGLLCLGAVSVVGAATADLRGTSASASPRTASAAP